MWPPLVGQRWGPSSKQSRTCSPSAAHLRTIFQDLDIPQSQSCSRFASHISRVPLVPQMSSKTWFWRPSPQTLKLPQSLKPHNQLSCHSSPGSWILALWSCKTWYWTRTDCQLSLFRMCTHEFRYLLYFLNDMLLVVRYWDVSIPLLFWIEYLCLIRIQV